MKITKLNFGLCLFLILTSVYSGPQQHGEWKKSLGLGTGAGALAAGAWGGPVGVAIGAAVYFIAGPLTSFFRCFEPNTLILTPNGYIPALQLSVNDLVFTHQNKISKVLDVHFDKNNHEFVKIHTNAGFIEVTPEHLMIVDQRLIQAKNLEIGMKLGTQKITKLQKTTRPGRVSIFTNDGSIIANGIPTTTICAEYEGLSLSQGLQKWKKEHKQLYPQLVK